MPRGGKRRTWTEQVINEIKTFYDPTKSIRSQFSALQDVMEKHTGYRPTCALQMGRTLTRVGLRKPVVDIWGDDVLKDVEDWVGAVPIKTVLKRLNAKHGEVKTHRYTLKALYVACDRYNIDIRRNTHDKLVTDLGRELDLSAFIVLRAAERIGVRMRSVGKKLIYILSPDVEKLRQHLIAANTTPWPAVTVKEAARRAGVETNCFYKRYLETNKVRHCLAGKSKMVNEEDLVALIKAGIAPSRVKNRPGKRGSQ